MGNGTCHQLAGWSLIPRPHGERKELNLASRPVTAIECHGVRAHAKYK